MIPLMLSLLLAMTATPPPPTDVLLFDDLLVTCHRAGVGWFEGPACEAAAAGATVRDHSGTQRTLPKTARDAQCGGVEGHRAFGERGGGTLWFSAGRVPVACPEEKAPTLSAAEKAAIGAAVKADHAAGPAAWRTYEEDRDARPFTAAFTVKSAVKLGGERFLNLRGFGRDLSATVRLDTRKRVTVIAREPYGPTTVLPDRCTDVDGDGAPEVLMALGGETERSYVLTRFIDGHPSAIATLGCGD